MGGGDSKASGGGSKNVSRGDIYRHDSSRPCPSGGEGSYSTHDICYKGRVYSDKGRADGCYDRTDKICTTSSSYPSAHSNSRGEKAVKVLAAKKKKIRPVGYLTAVLLNILAVIPVLFSAPYLQEKVILLIPMHHSMLKRSNLTYLKSMAVLKLAGKE